MLAGALPPNDHLVAALTVARVGSFTRAASDLGLSQPALSRQVMALEKHLGVRIFDRVGRSVRLTAAGEDLINRITPLLEEMSRVTINLATAANQAAGRVRLGTSESIAVHVLPALLRNFMNQHRRIDLRLTCSTTDNLPDMVGQGEVDLAVTSIEYEPPGLQVTPLWQDELVLVLPMNHSARSRTIHSYKNEEFILLSPRTITRRLLERELSELGVELKVVLEHNSSEVIKAMVSAGLGLAILPEPVVRREIRRGELAAWPLTDLKVVRPIVALSDPRRQPWPAELALLSSLSAYGKK